MKQEPIIGLSEYRSDLEKIVDIINKTFSIDVAIFDLKSRLVACTSDYLRQKGKTVHTPSIEEVIANKSVVVNKPGHMPTCRGCRFLGKCPAKIEILRSIRNRNNPMGVITFTSFSKQGHDKITGRIQEFIDALNHFADLIALLLGKKHSLADQDETGRILETSVKMMQEHILIFSSDGSVVQCSSSANELFSFCDLYTRSIYHILPQPVADKIMAGNFLKDTPLKIDGTQVLVSASPVMTNDVLTAAVVLLRRTGENTLMSKKESATSKKSSGINRQPEDMLGTSSEILQIKKKVKKLSSSSSTVLITGETGTGKGLLAKVIHFTSSRAKGPFVPVNCTSIPETLFESELFGYEEGAFTGAKKGGKPGRFELAQGGTLFLDEIGEMPLHIQVKLLNVLQDYAFQRVGGIHPVAMDVRIIAATNQNLEALIKEKKFRTDLYYRLNVIPFYLPPLVRRMSDIGMLCLSFLETSNLSAGKAVKDIDDEVMALFHAYHWPGNIRELQNVIEYAVNMEETAVITECSLPEWFQNRVPVIGKPDPETSTAREDMRSRVMMTEVETILACLERNGHDVKGKTRTARELGISLRTLYRKLGQCA